MDDDEDAAGVGASDYRILALKDIKTFDVFLGADDQWDAWVFSTEAALGDLGWEALLMAAKLSPEPLNGSTYTPEVRAVARNLYSLLAQRVKGKAQTLVKLIQGKDGFEAWRQLWQEYRPLGAEPSHSLLCVM